MKDTSVIAILFMMEVKVDGSNAHPKTRKDVSLRKKRSKRNKYLKTNALLQEVKVAISMMLWKFILTHDIDGEEPEAPEGTVYNRVVYLKN